MPKNIQGGGTALETASSAPICALFVYINVREALLNDCSKRLLSLKLCYCSRTPAFLYFA